MSSICLCFLDGSLEGCMHLVDQLLVPTAGNTLAVSLAAAAAAAARVAKCVQAALHNRAVE